MRLSLLAAATLLASTLAGHADPSQTFNVTGTFASGGSLSGTLTLNSTSSGFRPDLVASVTQGKYPFTTGATELSQGGDYFVNFNYITQNPNPMLVAQLDLYLPVTSLAGYNGSPLCSTSLRCGTSSDRSYLVINYGLGQSIDYLSSGSVAPSFPAATPEPSSLLLLVTGLLGAAGSYVRSRRTTHARSSDKSGLT